MTRLLAGATLMLMVLLPFIANGQEKASYVALKGGLFTFVDRVKDADIDTGFNGELVFGRYLSRNIALELGTGYFHDGVNKNYGNSIKGFPVTLSAKAIYPFKCAEVYAGGGAGLYFAKFHGLVGGRFADHGDTLYGAHLLIGGQMDVSSSFFLGVEGKYLFTNTGDFEALRSSLNGYVYTLNIGYRF